MGAAQHSHDHMSDVDHAYELAIFGGAHYKSAIGRRGRILNIDLEGLRRGGWENPGAIQAAAGLRGLQESFTIVWHRWPDDDATLHAQSFSRAPAAIDQESCAG